MTDAIPGFGDLAAIAKYGLLGILLALALGMLWLRDKQLQASWLSRLTDARATAEGLQKVIVDDAAALTAHVDAQKERNRAAEMMARATERYAAAIEHLILRVEDLIRRLDK